MITRTYNVGARIMYFKYFPSITYYTRFPWASKLPNPDNLLRYLAKNNPRRTGIVTVQFVSAELIK